MISLGLSHRRRSHLGAILRGRKGGLIDFRDRAMMWRDAGEAEPVTADGQPIGLARSRGQVAGWEFTQSVAGAFPTAQAGRAAFDAGDWLFGAAAVLDTTRSVTAVFIGTRARFNATTATAQTVLAFGTNAGGVTRAAMRVGNGGVVQAAARRLDGDTLNILAGGAGNVTAGVWYDIGMFWDVITGAVTARVDAAGVVSGSAASSGGPTSDTASARAAIGGNTSATPGDRLDGDLAYVLATGGDTLPTVAEWDAVRAVLA